MILSFRAQPRNQRFGSSVSPREQPRGQRQAIQCSMDACAPIALNQQAAGSSCLATRLAISPLPLRVDSSAALGMTEQSGVTQKSSAARWKFDLYSLAILLYAMMIAVSASAQMTGVDWCQSSNVPKESVAISLTAVGEHQVVALETGEPIQVCGYSYDLGGTTPTLEFDYGTRTTTDCDTGTIALTGAMSAATRDVVATLNLLTARGSNQLCIKLGGTSPTAVGVITFAQKTP